MIVAAPDGMDFLCHPGMKKFSKIGVDRIESSGYNDQAVFSGEQ